MSQGRKELRSVRLRLETTNGSAAAPRYIWRGMADMPEDEREVTVVEELVGIFGGTDRSYIPKLQSGITLGETELTFEQAPLLFAAAGFGSAGGSTHGASGSAVSFYFPIPASTVWPTQSFTIEAGEPAQGIGGEAEQLTYCLVNELTLSFKGGEAVTAESVWVAKDGTRTNASGSFSNVGTLVTPAEVILSGRGTVYLDPAVSGAVFGASAAPAGNVLGGQIKFEDMWALKFPVDSGALSFSTAVFVGAKITGELTFEHQAGGSQSYAGTAGQKEQWRTQQAQLLRINIPGGTINLGTTFANKLFRVDLPIKYTSAPALDDQDGNSIATLEFESHYNEDVPTAGRGTILVVRRAQNEHIN